MTVDNKTPIQQTGKGHISHSKQSNPQINHLDPGGSNSLKRHNKHPPIETSLNKRAIKKSREIVTPDEIENKKEWLSLERFQNMYLKDKKEKPDKIESVLEFMENDLMFEFSDIVPVMKASRIQLIDLPQDRLNKIMFHRIDNKDYTAVVSLIEIIGLKIVKPEIKQLWNAAINLIKENQLFILKSLNIFELISEDYLKLIDQQQQEKLTEAVPACIKNGNHALLEPLVNLDLKINATNKDKFCNSVIEYIKEDGSNIDKILKALDLSIAELPQDLLNQAVSACIKNGNHKILDSLVILDFKINDTNKDKFCNSVIEYIKEDGSNIDKILKALNLDINDLPQEPLNQVVLVFIEEGQYCKLESLGYLGFKINDTNKEVIHTSVMEFIKKKFANIDKILKALNLDINDLPQEPLNQVALVFIEEGQHCKLESLGYLGFKINDTNKEAIYTSVGEYIKDNPSYIERILKALNLDINDLPQEPLNQAVSVFIEKGQCCQLESLGYLGFKINDTNKEVIHTSVIEYIKDNSYYIERILKALNLDINDLPQEPLNQAVLGFFEPSQSTKTNKIQKAGFSFRNLPKKQVITLMNNSIKNKIHLAIDFYLKYYFNPNDLEYKELNNAGLLEHIESGFCNDLLNLPYFDFSRLSKEQIITSINKHIKNNRFLSATNLMKTSSIPIEDVQDECSPYQIETIEKMLKEQ